MARGLLSCQVSPKLPTSSSSSASSTTTPWITIATSHLESVVNSKQQYTEQRHEQLEYSTQRLTSMLNNTTTTTTSSSSSSSTSTSSGSSSSSSTTSRHVFLLGDLNWKDTTRKQLKARVKVEENDGNALDKCPKGWHDAWVDTKGEDNPGWFFFFFFFLFLLSSF